MLHGMATLLMPNVMGRGAGLDGQCGLGMCAPVSAPTSIPALRGLAVAQAACGLNHTVALLSSPADATQRRVFCW
jgi:hypothetical protein